MGSDNNKTVYDGGTTMPENGGATAFEGAVAEAAIAEAVAHKGEALSNDDIQKDSILMDTYRVDSNPIHGGMGSVWRVHHQNWSVDLAMKRPHAKLFVNEMQKANFIRECEAWINLGLHPNIVSCYYLRELGGVPTIFSEWMENGSLENRIKDGSVYEGTEEEVQKRLLDIAIQFACGLHYAHEAGLIHQDVKPDNLLLSKEWDAKVADFGLARARAQLTVLDGAKTVLDGDPGATAIAPSGGYTPAYCSMEQMDGKPLTRRTDIYSWAVSVLELYLGARPWTNGVVAGLSCQDYLAMCRVPMADKLKELLAKCMAVEPEDRPHDFSEVEAALKEIYRITAGVDYPRPESKAAADTADSINNRALSYLDLGLFREASQLWAQAIRTDNSNFRCHYNLAVTLWKNCRITAEQLYNSVMERKSDTPEWKAAYEAVRFAEVVTVDDIRRRLVAELMEADPSASVLTEEDIRRQAKQDGVALPEEPFYLFPFDGRFYWQEWQFDPDGTYDYSRDGKRSIAYDKERKCYVVRSADGELAFLGIEPDRVGGCWKFVDEKGEYLTTHNYDVHFISALTGRSLLIFHSERDWDDDVLFDHVRRCSTNGFVELENTNTMRRKLWLRLPPADPKVDYLLSRVESYTQRDNAMQRLQEVYPEAKKMFEIGNYAGALELLSPACEDGTLLQYEPALALWERLFPYCTPGKLVTVLPSDALWCPIAYDNTETAEIPPQGVAHGVEEIEADGLIVTAIENYTMSDNYRGGIDYDFTYSLRAVEASGGALRFTVDKLTSDSQSDEEEIDYRLAMQLSGPHLWYKKRGWPKSGMANLGNPEFQRKHGLRMMLPGEGDYFLKNTDTGVEIGGFAFDDEFYGIAPLWDAQVVQCRDRAYRLIYQYTGIREEAT